VSQINESPNQLFISKVTLKPLSPKEVYEDQIKMKTKRENERKGRK